MPRLRPIASALLASLLPILMAAPVLAQSNLGAAPQGQTLQPPRAPTATAPARPSAPQPPAAPQAAPGQVLTLPPRLQNQAPQRSETPRTQPRASTSQQAEPTRPPAQRPGTTSQRQAPAVQAPPRQERTRPAPQQQPSRAATGAAAAGAAGAAAAAAAPPAPARPEPVPDVGAVTGLPTPRFVALRSDEVNLRVGPDTRFPIEWTYQRRDLPVEVLREYNQWRRIRDMDGTEGWVHQSTLSARRTFLVRGQERNLHASDSDGSNVVARLQPGVVGRIRRCAAGSAWCEVQVADRRGYLKRADFWGVKPDEEIN